MAKAFPQEFRREWECRIIRDLCKRFGTQLTGVHRQGVTAAETKGGRHRPGWSSTTRRTSGASGRRCQEDPGGVQVWARPVSFGRKCNQVTWLGRNLIVPSPQGRGPLPGGRAVQKWINEWSDDSKCLVERQGGIEQ